MIASAPPMVTSADKLPPPPPESPRQLWNGAARLVTIPWELDAAVREAVEDGEG